jgi:hypothetical protein
MVLVASGGRELSAAKSPMPATVARRMISQMVLGKPTERGRLVRVLQSPELAGGLPALRPAASLRSVFIFNFMFIDFSCFSVAATRQSAANFGKRRTRLSAESRYDGFEKFSIS